MTGDGGRTGVAAVETGEVEDDESVKLPRRPRLSDIMGPGLITGASDDDPSGIATYSQAGAQFGFDLSWVLLLTYPLMAATQQISAQIGRVTGRGLGGNLRRHMPGWVLHPVVVLLVAANTINTGADLGAMGAALQLLVGGPLLMWVAGFAAVSAGLVVFMRYSRYVAVLKWLTISLFAYVAVIFAVHVPWGVVALRLVVPRVDWSGAYVTVVVAVLGTTISPYLFFWQASQEVENEREDPEARPLVRAPAQGAGELRRIRLDTYVGMGFSNVIALAIVLTAAATLHAHGVRDIQTSAQAAAALRPIAGRFAETVFAAGIVGTGMLAVPVLAGSAAFAVGEAWGWRVGLARRPGAARRFYGVIVGVIGVGAALNGVGVDPVKALFWSAVVNGVVAVPVMAAMMVLGGRARVMGPFVLGRGLRVVGWVATGVMGVAAAAMVATWGD